MQLTHFIVLWTRPGWRIAVEADVFAAIEEKYGAGSDYAAQVALACKIVMASAVSPSKTEAA